MALKTGFSDHLFVTTAVLVYVTVSVGMVLKEGIPEIKQMRRLFFSGWFVLLSLHLAPKKIGKIFASPDGFTVRGRKL